MAKFAIVTVLAAAAVTAVGAVSAQAGDMSRTPNWSARSAPVIRTWRGNSDAWMRAAEAEEARGHHDRARTAVFIRNQIEMEAAVGAANFTPYAPLRHYRLRR